MIKKQMFKVKKNIIDTKNPQTNFLNALNDPYILSLHIYNL